MTITFSTDTSTTIQQRMLGSGPGLPPALPNYPAQSATTIDGSSAALFGLPFMVAGVFIGLAAFDVIQQQDDPTRFVFLEAYRTPEAPAVHKETRHYQTWRDTVAPMMAEPRASTKFNNVFPEDKDW